MRTSLVFLGISLTKAEECSSGALVSLLFPLSILVRQKSSLELFYREEHLDVHARLVSVPIRVRITGKEMVARDAFASSYVSASHVNGMRYVLDDFKFHWCSNLMQIAELSGDNVVPREKVSARSALACSAAFRIRGVLKKGINRAHTLVTQFSRSNSEMLQYKWRLMYLLESDLN